jgi:hypothetical protein
MVKGLLAKVKLMKTLKPVANKFSHPYIRG